MSHIALLPGDGIGPEVTAAAVAVLEAADRRFGLDLRFSSHPIGAHALRETGSPLPEATLAACRGANAVFLGAVGDPAYDRAPREQRPERGLLRLRAELGVFANLRPAAVWPPLAGGGPFAAGHLDGVDMLIVRELAGGLYYGEPRGAAPDGQSVLNTMRYSAGEVTRVARVAFEAARRRRGRLTSVDKANVLETSQLWRDTVEAVAGDYPDVALDHLYVDACAMLLVLEPRRFDVVLTENLFGDILSDEAGALVGSLGLLPSASLGPGPGLYEPVHGSAPALAGRDVANPIGAIASAALLLRHSLGHEAAAGAVERAVGGALADGLRTADIAGGAPACAGSAMAAAIAARVAGA
jgi:3-isopropylmalate dehydrogenase